MKGAHIVSGPLVTRYSELIRHRDESSDPQVEVGDGVWASRPATHTIPIDGLDVEIPTGFRPIFVHNCPAFEQAVTLYADTEGGSVNGS
jgi:hypothetical protein